MATQGSNGREGVTMPTTNRIESQEDSEALVLGLGMFATGGGGLAERGRGYLRSLLDDGVDIEWTEFDQVDPETLTCSVFSMGSIAPRAPMSPEEMRRYGVDGELHPRPWLRAVQELEEHLGESIGAVIPLELGPANTLVAVDAAARSGRTLIDGDYMGRALPKMSQALPALLGLDVWPLTICDPWGNALVMLDCPSPEVAERVGKMVSRVTRAVDMAAPCAHAAFPNRASRLTGAMVPGTLSRGLEMGRRMIKARAEGKDTVAVAVEAGHGALLFQGTVSDRRWEDTADGYMKGTTVIAGKHDHSGVLAEIWFLNEHHVMWRDGSVAAASPDLIAVVDGDSAEPISNTLLQPGMEVAVIGFPGPSVYRSGKPLTATAPRSYGLDIDWTPIEKLNPAGSWR